MAGTCSRTGTPSSRARSTCGSSEMSTGLVIDLGSTSAAMVAAEGRTWLLPEPNTGERRWRSAAHWRHQPNELVAFLAAIRGQAHRTYGALDRAVLTVPMSLSADDPRRGFILAAAEA